MPFGAVTDKPVRQPTGPVMWKTEQTIPERLEMGRSEISLLGYQWLTLVDRLHNARAWFASARFKDDPQRWAKNLDLRNRLESEMVMCMLRLTWQVKDYADACLTLTDDDLAEEIAINGGYDPRNPRAIWLSSLPCPHQCHEAFGSGSAHTWWPHWAYPLPDHETECLAGQSLAPWHAGAATNADETLAANPGAAGGTTLFLERPLLRLGQHDDRANDQHRQDNPQRDRQDGSSEPEHRLPHIQLPLLSLM